VLPLLRFPHGPTGLTAFAGEPRKFNGKEAGRFFMHLSFRKLREALAVFFALGILGKEGKCFALFFFSPFRKRFLAIARPEERLKARGIAATRFCLSQAIWI